MQEVQEGDGRGERDEGGIHGAKGRRTEDGGRRIKIVAGRTDAVRLPETDASDHAILMQISRKMMQTKPIFMKT